LTPARPKLHTYLAERYWPGADEAAAHAAAGRLATEGRTTGDATPVSCTFVPSEEVLMCVVRAPSEADVRSLGRDAGLPFDHIVAVVVLPIS
jgi:Protein of unknown function (DUF4242)